MLFTAIQHSYKTLVSKKNHGTGHPRQQGAVRIGRSECSIIFAKKFTALTAARCSENWLRKVWIFKTIPQSYKPLVSKKKMALTAARCRENRPNRQVKKVLDTNSTALTAAVCRENYQRKVWFFTTIRHSYKILVNKKSHGTHCSKVPWELANLTSQ